MDRKSIFLISSLVILTVLSFYFAYQRFFIDKDYEIYFSEEEAEDDSEISQ